MTDTAQEYDYIAHFENGETFLEFPGTGLHGKHLVIGTGTTTRRGTDVYTESGLVVTFRPPELPFFPARTMRDLRLPEKRSITKFVAVHDGAALIRWMADNPVRATPGDEQG
jgi:hypothetical protein